MGGVVDSIFGGAPSPKPLPPAPSRTDPAVEAARKRIAVANRARAGRAGTFFTTAEEQAAPAPISRPVLKAKTG